jgi:polar amino acid transport system substrate-binding protein
MPRRSTITLLLMALLVWGVTAGGTQPQKLTDRPLIVGTKESPPFAIKNPDGSWRGISIELWRDIAAELGLTYELREQDLQGLLDGVKNGSLDLAVAALSITADREKTMDFSHPFYTTGLGIAIPRGKHRDWLGLFLSFFSWQFLQVIGGLAAVLLIVGFLVWLSERRKNPQHFGGGVITGIWSGFWWAAVTMTTVGYGDKAPATVLGRVLALIWMFTGLIIVSSFIAAITTALTVTQLGSSIEGPQDLTRAWVGTIAGSTSETYLRQNHIASRQFQTPLEGLRAVAAGEVDAMVYDAPLLRYLATTELPGKIEVLPATFERQDYGIAMSAGSALREPINRVLLDKITQPAWKDLLYRYMGVR